MNIDNDKLFKILKRTFHFDKMPKEVVDKLETYLNFRNDLMKESDRGCALLAAAHLDYMLGVLLKNKLIGNKEHTKNLFGVNGPLGTFSSRIMLSYSIGLISRDVLHDIQIIRKIRNEFAHINQAIGFDNKKIASLCNSLRLSMKDKEKNPKAKFIGAFTTILGHIEFSDVQNGKFAEEKCFDIKEFKKSVDDMTKIAVNKL